MIPRLQWNRSGSRSGRFFQVKVKIDGKYKSASEGAWLFVGRIKIPCFYFLYEVKVRKSSLRKNIKQYEI